MDAQLDEASYQTTSVYGFGHPLYYDNVIRSLRGEAHAEIDGREGLKSLELLIADVPVGARRQAHQPAAGLLSAWRSASTPRPSSTTARVLGDGCRVWHFVHISAGARIGARLLASARTSTSATTCVIGDNVKIQNNVSVYDAVTLEDDVFCGPSMVFTNVYNPRAAVPRKDEYRRTLVQRGATLGANCTVVCGITIGEHAFVGAGAVVNRDVPDFALMVGVPARQHRLDEPPRRAAGRCRCDGEGEAVCPHTGDRYRLQRRHRLQLEA